MKMAAYIPETESHSNLNRTSFEPLLFFGYSTMCLRERRRLEPFNICDAKILLKIPTGLRQLRRHRSALIGKTLDDDFPTLGLKFTVY